jgi:hypothetical protein
MHPKCGSHCCAASRRRASQSGSVVTTIAPLAGGMASWRWSSPRPPASIYCRILRGTVRPVAARHHRLCACMRSCIAPVLGAARLFLKSLTASVVDLDLSGLTIPEQISASHSGVRIVAVDEERISHRWFAMDEIPEVVDPAQAAQAWHSPPRECRL